MSVLAVIPARLESTRLPGKVLLRETGKYLVQHVYERAMRIRGVDDVIVAVDDPRTQTAVESFGGKVVMTSRKHRSGTDRAAEVARACDVDVVVNLQADEPELRPDDVAALIDGMRDAEMGTLVFPRLSDAEQADPSVVKAIVEDGWAVDFRREPTPGGQRHLGIYAYSAAFLQRFTTLPESARETDRKLEQMRALDAGVKIRAVTAQHAGVGIDTPADYDAFVSRFRYTGS